MNRIVVNFKNQLKSIAWYSLMPDGSISWGLSDRNFIVHEISNGKTTKKTQLVQNPHFTFHPPMCFHLIGNNSFRITEWITCLDICIEEDHLVEWFELNTRKLSSIPSFNGNLNNNDGIISLDIIDDCSLLIKISFISEGTNIKGIDCVHNENVIWKGRIMNILVFKSFSIEPNVRYWTIG